MPSGIKLIAPIRTQPARQRLNAPLSISLGTVAMISGQRWSCQAAGSTSHTTSWPLDHWIGMRSLTRIMMMTTGRIPERRAVDGAVLAMKMTITTPRVGRTRGAVRKGPGRGREQKLGRGKERGRGRGMVKGKVLLNCMRQSQTQRDN